MTSAPPTTNQITISIDGTALPHETLDLLLDAEVDTSVGLPSMFTLRFHDSTMELTDSAQFDPGKSVEIKLKPNAPDGSTTNASFRSVMKGEITSIETNFSASTVPILTVRGYDRSHRLNRGAKTRVFVNAKHSDVVKKICSENGLSPRVDETAEIYDHVFQDNQSDQAFIASLARRNGYEVFIDDRTLHFRKSRGADKVRLEYGTTLREFTPRMSLTGQIGEVVVRGWDPAQKKEIVGSARSSSSAPEVGAGSFGGKLAAKFFSDATGTFVRLPVTSQRSAEAHAQALLDANNADFIVADGTAFGDPAIIAGCKVEIPNIGKRFSGSYVVTSATHIYSPDGYDTYFKIEGTDTRLMIDVVSGGGGGGVMTTSSSADETWAGVVTGIVTNIDDPQNMGRAKVMFPWLDDKLESNWARVSGIGAGKDRGFYIMPEVGDEVLVAFEQGNFNFPYIIGNLWNGKDGPPDNGVKNGKVQIRTLKSREGHVIRLSDEPGKKFIEIEDSAGGTHIKLNADDKSLTVKSGGDITLETKAKMTLKALSILIEAQTTAEMKGMTAKLDGSAQAEIKGGIVMIN